MRKIVYYVASSIDGYIAGPEEDISGFLQEGKGIDQYKNDLLEYDSVIMGRKTYEFGYKYGLKPGMLAYPHMKHFVFSDKLVIEERDPNLEICPLNLGIIDHIKSQKGSDIYLCGGGTFASWLLQHKRIDQLKIKLNPFIQGSGTAIFEGLQNNFQLELLHTEAYKDGLFINTYNINY